MARCTALVEIRKGIRLRPGQFRTEPFLLHLAELGLPLRSKALDWLLANERNDSAPAIYQQALLHLAVGRDREAYRRRCELLLRRFEKAGDMYDATQSARACGLPGMIGIASDWARSRARVLSPNSSRVSGRGPMKARPSARQRRANAAFSARKP